MFGEIEYDPTRQYSSIPMEEQLYALTKAVESGKVEIVGHIFSFLFFFFSFQISSRHLISAVILVVGQIYWTE